MAWWDEQDDTVDRDFSNPSINLVSTLYGNRQPVAQGPVTQSGQRPTPARPSQNVPTREQAAQQSGWGGVVQQLNSALRVPASQKMPTRRPSSNRVSANQNVPTREQAQAQSGWNGVINRLRPALNQNRVTYDVQPQRVDYARPSVDTGSQNLQASQVINPTTTVQATRLRGSTVPRDEQYYTQNEPVQTGQGVGTSVVQPQDYIRLVNTVKETANRIFPKDDNKYTWQEMAKDNLGGLWDSAASRYARDWADTFEAGKGNFFNPTAEAAQQQQSVQAARENNQALVQRAFELRLTYYNNLPSDSRPRTIGDVPLMPFISQAETELGKTLAQPSVSPLTQAASVVSGITRNLAQTPGLLQLVPGLKDTAVANIASPGGLVNVFGNTLGTLVDALGTTTRSAVQIQPVQVGGPDPLLDENVANDFAKYYPMLGDEGDPRFVTVGEIVGAAMDAAINPSRWWANPGNWTFERNPFTLYQQAWADNVQQTVDTIYSLGPAVGEDKGTYDDRYARAIGTANLDLSGPQAQQQYVEAVVNKDKKLAELEEQRKAAVRASENQMLPSDVRESQALIAAQTQGEIDKLRNADAIQLAEEYIKPMRDAIGQTLLDPTFWYDIGAWLDPKTFLSMAPQARRLRAIEEVSNRSNEEIAKVVSQVVEGTGDRSWMYGALWEGGLSRVNAEVTDAKRFLGNTLAYVTDKTDVPKVLQYIVDNPAKFATDGIPADLVTSPRLRALANERGLIELPNFQVQEKEFEYLFNSLKSLSGQFGRLPALALEKGNVRDVIEDLLSAVEIQSAVRNKVSPFIRGVPLGTVSAEVETSANAAGDLIYKTIYKDKEGTVLARYLTPTEDLARKEVQLANDNIKAGKYLDRNYLDLATRFYRNSFSQQVLVTVPGSWVNNAIGAQLTGFVTGSNTMTPGKKIFEMVDRLFPNGAPYEYLLRDASGQVIGKDSLWESIPKVKDIAKRLREIRGGHTEIPLPGGRVIKFGENANKAGAWYKGVQRALKQTLDTDWRQIGEPIMAAMQLDPAALRTVRTFVDRLANDADIKTFYDNVTQYAIGRKQMLDVAGTVGKTYDTVLSERQLWAQVDTIIEQAAGDPQKFKQLWTEMLDSEIAKAADTAGYDAALTTIPHSTTGDIAEMLRDTTVSIEQLARGGVAVGPEAQTINQSIASLQDHVQRVWSLATNARTPEAIQQAADYATTLRQLHRDVQEELSRLMLHAKSTNLPADWNAYHQARLQMYQEYGQRAIQEGEQMLLRVLGQTTEAPIEPAIASIDTVVTQAESAALAELTQAADSLRTQKATIDNAVAQIDALSTQLQDVHARLLAAGQANDLQTATELIQESVRIQDEIARLAEGTIPVQPTQTVQVDPSGVVITPTEDWSSTTGVTTPAGEYVPDYTPPPPPPPPRKPKLPWNERYQVINPGDSTEGLTPIDDEIARWQKRADDPITDAYMIGGGGRADARARVRYLNRMKEGGVTHLSFPDNNSYWPIYHITKQEQIPVPPVVVEQAPAAPPAPIVVPAPAATALPEGIIQAGTRNVLIEDELERLSSIVPADGIEAAFVKQEIATLRDAEARGVKTYNVPSERPQGYRALRHSDGTVYYYDPQRYRTGQQAMAAIGNSAPAAPVVVPSAQGAPAAPVVAPAAPVVAPAAPVVGGGATTLRQRLTDTLNQLPKGQPIRLSDLATNFSDTEWADVLAFLRGQQIDGKLILMPAPDPSVLTAADKRYALDVGGGQTRELVYMVGDIQPPVAPAAAPVVAPAAPAAPRQVVQHTFPEDISNFDPSDYADRGFIYSDKNFQEAQHFFRRAEEIYRDTYMAAAQASGDLRSMDIFLQTQADINRVRSEFYAKLDTMRREMQQTIAAGGDKTAAYAKFYGFKAEGHYDLATYVNAKLKAATAYLRNLPEPITFRHSSYGDVTVLGYRMDGVAIRLPNGQIAVVAEDAVPATTMQKVMQRQQMLKAAATNPLASTPVEGIPATFAKEVDVRAEQYYKDLLSSRNNMYTATPTVSDAVADQILLLHGLRNKADKLAQTLVSQAKTALDPKQVSGLVDYANHIKRQFPKYAEAASTYGDFLQSKHMIDFKRHYRVDQFLAPFFPYTFWNTRTMKNMFERIATQPTFRHLMDTESAFFEQVNDDPNKEYVPITIGGRTYNLYVSLGKYMTSVGDYSADPTYYEKRAMDGPLGFVYAIEAATGASSYPYIDAVDNWLRKHVTGQEDTNTSFWESSPWARLGWNVANYMAGTNLVKHLPFAFTDRDSSAINTNLSVKVNNGQLTQRQAMLAGAVLEDHLYQTGFPAKMTEAQKKEGEQILNAALIEYYGWSTMTNVIQMITGQTLAAPQPGLAELRQAQSQYFAVEYPGNPGGGTMAQAAVRAENPGIATYWNRYRLDNDERATAQSEPLGIQARRMELQEKLDKTYQQQSDAVTAFILSKAGTVANYKDVQAIEKKYAEERRKLEAEYGDLPEQTFGPRNLAKMNTYERTLYQLEQILRYDGQKPAYPAEDATPEERVKAFADMDAWERARLDYIELTLNALDVPFENGDPVASGVAAKLLEITQNEYASELVRKYLGLKYAGRVERQWSEFGSLEKEMDQFQYQAYAENVTARLGKDVTYKWKVYQNQVNPENKAKYLDSHPEVALAITAAYNPEAWDEAVRLFGQEAWTTYKAFKAAKPKYPEGGSEQQIQDYYKALDAVRKKYPQAEEIEFWVDGRYRWWYGSGDEQYRTPVPGVDREGKFGWDYQQAQELFGENIFEIEAAYPSGGSKKQIAQFYDMYPQYSAYRAWLKQYQMREGEPMSVADLPQLDMANLPPEQKQIPASIPPYWTQYTDISRPFGSGRVPINETPEQKQQRLVLEARFQAAQTAEKAKQAALKTRGRAAVVDSNSWADKVDDEYSRRYGRSRRSTRRYYSGGRRGSYGGGRSSYRSGGGGGGGGGGYYPTGGTQGSINPSLWSQPRREVTPLNVGGDINPALWGSLLEKLKRPGR